MSRTIYFPMKDTRSPYYYLVVDVETTGQNYVDNDMLSFGACVINAKNGEIVWTFKVFIKPRCPTHLNDITGSFDMKAVDARFEKRCNVEFWEKNEEMKKVKMELLKNCEEKGYTGMGAMSAFHYAVNALPYPILRNMCILTDTSGFDIGWMDYYLSLARLPSMNYIIGGEYRPTFCTTSLLFGYGIHYLQDGLWGSEKGVCRMLGIDFDDFENANPYKHDHDPLNDARHIAWSFVSLEHLLIQTKQQKQQ
jgi:hypothetical protein